MKRYWWCLSPVGVVAVFGLASYIYITSQNGYITWTSKAVGVVLTKGGYRSWYVSTVSGFPRLRYSDKREEQQRSAKEAELRDAEKK